MLLKQMKTRILICDAHELVRRSVASLLRSEPDLDVVADCSDGHQLLSVTMRTRPDVVILNVLLPGLNGIEVTHRLTRMCPSTRVIALSSHNSEASVQGMLNAGAVGYLLASATTSELLAAIRFATRGKLHLSAEVGHAMSARLGFKRASLNGKGGARQHALVPERRSFDRRRINVAEVVCPLSLREREVLQLIAEGSQAKEIATTLGVSEPTIKSHRENIKRKLRISTTAALTVYAARIGLICVDGPTPSLIFHDEKILIWEALPV